LGELNYLKTQASQMDLLKQQLNELNYLKEKINELSGVQGQLDELNKLRKQVAEINSLKKQIEQLGNLKAKAHDMEDLRRRLKNLENIKAKYEEEIRRLKEKEIQIKKEEQIIKIKSEIKGNTGMDSKELAFEGKPRQICIKGEIIQSVSELEFITRKIGRDNKRLVLNLLYKATADSDKAAAFHEKCDFAKSSLVLVETDKGKRFGGFTTCSWKGEEEEEKKDENAFLFSFDKMKTYDIIPEESAIGCYSELGPVFLGCQIKIFDDAFSKGGSTAEKGKNFNTQEDYELTDGEKEFKIKDIEVYEVIAQ
jgi:hypothetical protein